METRRQRELREYLKAHLRRACAVGRQPRVVTIGHGEWLALGRPDVMLGVRIRPIASATRIDRRQAS